MGLPLISLVFGEKRPVDPKPRLRDAPRDALAGLRGVRLRGTRAGRNRSPPRPPCLLFEEERLARAEQPRGVDEGFRRERLQSRPRRLLPRGEIFPEAVVRRARESRDGRGALGAPPPALRQVRVVELGRELRRQRGGGLAARAGRNLERDLRAATLAPEHVGLGHAPPAPGTRHRAHRRGLGEPTRRAERGETAQEIAAIAGARGGGRRTRRVAQRARRGSRRVAGVEVEHGIQRGAETRAGVVRHARGRESPDERPSKQPNENEMRPVA